MTGSSKFICKHCSQCHLSLSALRPQLNLENKLRFFCMGPWGKADGSKRRMINITHGFITFNAFERFLGLFAVWLALLFKIPKLTVIMTYSNQWVRWAVLLLHKILYMKVLSSFAIYCIQVSTGCCKKQQQLFWYIPLLRLAAHLLYSHCISVWHINVCIYLSCHWHCYLYV